MKTEIYECDRCHKKAITNEERSSLGLGQISVGFTHGYLSNGGKDIYAAHDSWSKDWCRACRAEIGCLEEKIKEAAHTKNNNVPTLESIVREIVRQELPQ